MLPRSEQQLFDKRDRGDRFAADAAREILGRAAAEQHRLESDQASSYSLEELEEMAAEAGISRDALRIAIAKCAYRPPPARGRWYERIGFSGKGLLLTAAGGIGLVGLMLAFPVLAWAFFWLTVAVGILILLGISPF